MFEQETSSFLGKGSDRVLICIERVSEPGAITMERIPNHVDFDQFAIGVYSGFLKAKEKDELAPGLKVPSGTPPVFLAHGGDDIVSSPEHSVLMYLALKRAGVPAELHVYASTAHDFGVRKTDRPYSIWTDSCVRWLEDQGLLEPPTEP